MTLFTLLFVLALGPLLVFASSVVGYVVGFIPVLIFHGVKALFKWAWGKVVNKVYQPKTL